MNINRDYSWRRIKFTPYLPTSTIFMYGNHPGKFQENICEVLIARMVTETVDRIHTKGAIFV